MKVLSLLIHKFSNRLVHYSEYYRLSHLKANLGLLASTADLRLPDSCSCPGKVYLHENTNLYAHAKLIISPVGDNGKFIMLPNSGAAEGLTVVTGNHQRLVGHWFKELMYAHETDIDKDVIVEEDVWIGANVTLLAGVRVGRGATVAACSLCTKSIPPYAIVMGNPAKVIGFNMAPEEIVEHEEKLYPENQRLPIEKLQRNYQKYYLDRIDEINTIIK